MLRLAENFLYLPVVKRLAAAEADGTCSMDNFDWASSKVDATSEPAPQFAPPPTRYEAWQQGQKAREQQRERDIPF